jgi:hypothetical protein
MGGALNLAFNFPFQFTSSLYSPNCSLNDCPSGGTRWRTALQQINQGL